MNLPNKLTLFRIVLVPVILLVWLFPYGTFGISIPSFPVGPVSLSVLNIVVLVLFLIASFTDMLDGKIARKYNQVTNFGKFMDPLADKMLVLTAINCLLIQSLLYWHLKVQFRLFLLSSCYLEIPLSTAAECWHHKMV